MLDATPGHRRSASPTSCRCAPTPPAAPSWTPCAGIAAHVTVDTRIEDGDPVVAVTVAPGTDVGAVGALLGRYAITWELAVAAPTATTSTKE